MRAADRTRGMTSSETSSGGAREWGCLLRGTAALPSLLRGYPRLWMAKPSRRSYLESNIEATQPTETGRRTGTGNAAAAGFRVVAPDTRGYNLSSKPEGFEAYAVDVLADDI